MAFYGVCNKKISQTSLKIKCEDCERVFHGSCVKMSKPDIDTLVSENLTWRCDPCQSVRRKSMRFESQASAGELNVEDVMRLLKEIQAEQVRIVKDLNISQESMHDELARNTSAVAAQTAKMEDFLGKFEEVVAENRQLKKKIIDLEVQLDDAEQYSRRNTLEIHGVPLMSQRETQEQCLELVKKVGAGLGCDITEVMIDACHRLRQDRLGGSRPPAIVVKFVRRIDKDKLLEKKRGRRDFSTRHMGLSMDTPVFINESLTRARRILFAKSREAKRRAGYKYLWHRGGRILMRKSEAGEVIAVTCLADLEKLH